MKSVENVEDSNQSLALKFSKITPALKVFEQISIISIFGYLTETVSITPFHQTGLLIVICAFSPLGKIAAAL